MVLEHNMFVEQILPGAMLRKLSDEEMTEYRRPFAEPGEARRADADLAQPAADRRRTGRRGGDRPLVCRLASHSGVPKLFIKGEPGAILASGTPVECCRSWPSESESTVRGVHFLQEDSPDEIGYAIAVAPQPHLKELNQEVTTSVPSSREERAVIAIPAAVGASVNDALGSIEPGVLPSQGRSGRPMYTIVAGGKPIASRGSSAGRPPSRQGRTSWPLVAKPWPGTLRRGEWRAGRFATRRTTAANWRARARLEQRSDHEHQRDRERDKLHVCGHFGTA
jgi:hypothetical protein